MATSIGERIKIARKNARITQQALSDYVGVSRAAVTQWESGETKGLKPENLVLAAEKLAVSVKWLAMGKGPMKGPDPADLPDRAVHLARLISQAPPEKVQAILVLLEEKGLDPPIQREDRPKRTKKPLPPTVKSTDSKARAKRLINSLGSPEKKKKGGENAG